jgi:hypothetical protein
MKIEFYVEILVLLHEYRLRCIATDILNGLVLVC